VKALYQKFMLLFTKEKKQPLTFKESLTLTFEDQLIDFHRPNLFSLMALEKPKNS